MSRPLTAVDFFTLEANDCLSRIEQLLTAFETPPGDELLRAARALRGAAVLAQHDVIADAAAGFETLARALRGGLAWSDATRDAARRTVGEFREVVRAAATWTDADDQRARGIARTLAALAGQPAGAAATAAPAGASRTLAPGVRAFVAREGALVASALADAGRRLREQPDDRTVLQPAARRLLALRGLGDITELSPLPEILDAIELLADDLPRVGGAPPTLPVIADAAAAALARVCREVAGDGMPAPDAPDARHLLALVIEAVAIERDAVPVADLLAAGERPPGRRLDDHGAPLPALTLVSLGEHLAQAGDVIARAPRALTRELRAYAAIVALRRASSGGPPASALRQLLVAVREALARGILTEAPEELGLALRDAGRLLRQATDDTDRALLAAALADLAARLAWPAPAHATPATPAPAAPGPGPGPGIEFEEEAPLPVSRLVRTGAAAAAATSEDEGEIVPIATLLADEPATRNLLAESFEEYARLRADDAARTEAVAEPAPVDVRSLCYRGAAALARALEVRQALVDALARQASLADLRGLLDELLDLVPAVHADA